MAFFASAFGITGSKLTAMKIGMTITAMGKWYSAMRFSRLMARFALHKFVFSFQRKPAFIMVKFARWYTFPTGGGVAFFASGTKPPAMDVCMAINAVLKFRERKLQESMVIRESIISHSVVALFALDGLMFSGERETGCIVI